MGITRRADTMSGAYCIAGTRIPVSMVKSYVRLGYDADHIIAEFPSLTHEQINCALAFRSKPKAAPEQEQRNE